MGMPWVDLMLERTLQGNDGRSSCFFVFRKPNCGEQR